MKAELKLFVAAIVAMAALFAGFALADDADAEETEIVYEPILLEQFEDEKSTVKTATKNGKELLKFELIADKSIDLMKTTPEELGVGATNYSMDILEVIDSNYEGFTATSISVQSWGKTIYIVYSEDENDNRTLEGLYVDFTADVTFSKPGNSSALYVIVEGIVKIAYDNTLYSDNPVYNGKVHYATDVICLDSEKKKDPEERTKLKYVAGDESAVNVMVKSPKKYTTQVALPDDSPWSELQNEMSGYGLYLFAEQDWKIIPKSINHKTITVSVGKLEDGSVETVVYDSERGVYLVLNKDYKISGFDSATPYTGVIGGINNYKDSRVASVPITIDGTIHVNVINYSGSIDKATFEGKLFVFPADEDAYGFAIPSSAYTITVKDGWGQLVFSDNAAELEKAKEAGVTPTGVTSSEWNWIRVDGNEENGYEGFAVGSFMVDFSSYAPSSYEIGSTFSEDGIVYTVTSLDNKTASVTGYGSEIEAAVAIPDVVNGFKVTKIGTKAFYGCKTITSVDLGENIVSVGVKAFANCTKLSAVVFDDALKTVSAYAFYNCGKLTEVDFSDSVKTIGSYAFYKCSALKSVSFDGALKTVGTKAFAVTFEDASGKTLKQTAKVLAGKTFEGSNGVLKLVA